MKAMFDQVTEKNVRICWNCNDTDLLPLKRKQVPIWCQNGLAIQFTCANSILKIIRISSCSSLRESNMRADIVKARRSDDRVEAMRKQVDILTMTARRKEKSGRKIISTVVRNPTCQAIY